MLDLSIIQQFEFSYILERIKNAFNLDLSEMLEACGYDAYRAYFQYREQDQEPTESIKYDILTNLSMNLGTEFDDLFSRFHVMDQRFLKDLKEAVGESFHRLIHPCLSGEVAPTSLPTQFVHIGAIGGASRRCISTYSVYRAHVSLDDAFLHRWFKVEGIDYFTTIYEGAIAAIVTRHYLKGNYLTMSADEFRRLFKELPEPPDRDVAEELNTHNMLWTAL